MDYLTKGILWDSGNSLLLIGNINTTEGYKMAIYPEYLDDLRNYIDLIESETGSRPSQILIPIDESYMTIGPLDPNTRDNVIPSRKINQDDLNFYNNQSCYDKIYDNGLSFAYILNV